jgi:hypothetical protein
MVKEFRVYSASVSREMYDRHLLRFNCSTAASLQVEIFVNYRLYPSPVALGHWSRYPSSVGVHERDGSTIPVDLGLHQICIEEQRRHRDKRDSCASSSYDSSLLSELSPLIIMVAVRSEQNASTHRRRPFGIALASIRCNDLKLNTPFYSPFTPNLIRLTT